MSAPPSEGRQSVSSEPSATSSHTLNSRYSGVYQGNGEGSSPQRPSLGSRYNSGGEHAAPDGRSRHAESPLSAEAIEEQDFASRRQRNRKSGGFLLDSAFGGGLRNRHTYNGPSAGDPKGKHAAQKSPGYDKGGVGTRPPTGDSAANGSPLSRAFRTAGPDAAGEEVRLPSASTQEPASGELQISKTRKSAYGMQSTAHERVAGPDHEAPRATIDPTQIVHMALNLSESRRRNLSAGQLLAPQPRVASGVHQDGSFHAGGSLRHYLNEQRRNSRNISPGGGRNNAARHMSASMQRSGSLYIEGRPFNPSDATLARRDKAQAFFELRIEYLRLLEFLPPLKPDASEPSNFIVTTNNVPGSPHTHMTRTPSYAGKRYNLGRQYNPLQLLRNRRTRARERKVLKPAPEDFSNVDQVRDWVNIVEKVSRHPQYRQQDAVTLPELHAEHETTSIASKPTRPHMIWKFSAEELLADAHWLEHGDNKILIEDRHGRRIFAPKEPSKGDLLQPRSSKDYPEKRRRSWIDGLPGLPGEPTTGDESETLSERGRKRKLLPTFRAESPKTKRHTRTGSKLQMDAHSDTSDSDSDARRLRSRKPRIIMNMDDNTGPLELRMRALMEKEAKEAQAKGKSPAIFTPDTPNKWGHRHDDPPDTKTARSSLEVPGTANGSVKSVAGSNLKLPPKNRTDAGVPLVSASEPRSSFESYGSTRPGTPVHSGHSPPPSRAGTEKKESKKHRLDIFRSDETPKSNRTEPEPTASDKKRSSRQTSEELDDGSGIGAAIWAAPGAVKHLLHRKNESVNSLQSPVKDSRKEFRDSKEPPSAVTRFFKGVKHEGSKVGEFIFRKDRPPGDTDVETASDHADSDSDDGPGKREGRRRPNFTRNTTAETAGSVTSKENGRYHIDLPTFRSSNANSNKLDADRGHLTDSSLHDHPITRQARERANSRSPRFDQLAPPRMDLSRITSNSSTAENHARINKILARPGGVGQLPVTALGKGNASHNDQRHRSASRPTLEGKRHWSITDDDGNVLQRKAVQHVVTQADIARIRALFLCSGVKAKEIARRAYSVRPEAPEFLTRAAKTVNAKIYPVSRKEEHVLAAHILVNNLEWSTQSLHTSADKFRDGTVQDLTDMISKLKSKVESDLFPRVRSNGDQAIQITSEVSGNAPLTVKQINDEIDRMLRMRKRRMRYLRRVGWTALEWMLVGFMWLAWLSVTVTGFVGRIFGFAWRVVRWLLWL
jgi:hypothetical protein